MERNTNAEHLTHIGPISADTQPTTSEADRARYLVPEAKKTSTHPTGDTLRESVKELIHNAGDATIEALEGDPFVLSHHDEQHEGTPAVRTYHVDKTVTSQTLEESNEELTRAQQAARFFSHKAPGNAPRTQTDIGSALFHWMRSKIASGWRSLWQKGA